MQHTFNHDIYFNARKRRKMELVALNVKREIEKFMDDFDSLDLIRQEKMVLAEKFADFTLHQIMEAKVWWAKQELRQRHFTIYRHPFSATVVILFEFFKVAEKKRKINAAVYPHGLPTSNKRRVKGYFYHQAVKVEGYSQMQAGTFRQKRVDEYRVINTLWNRHFYMKYEITGDRKEKGVQWCRLMI